MPVYNVTFVEANTAAEKLKDTSISIENPTGPNHGNVEIRNVPLGDGTRSIGSLAPEVLTRNAFKTYFGDPLKPPSHTLYDMVVLIGSSKVYGSISVRSSDCGEDTAPGVWEADEEDPEEDKAGRHGKHRSKRDHKPRRA